MRDAVLIVGAVFVCSLLGGIVGYLIMFWISHPFMR